MKQNITVVWNIEKAEVQIIVNTDVAVATIANVVLIDLMLNILNT